MVDVQSQNRAGESNVGRGQGTQGGGGFGKESQRTELTSKVFVNNKPVENIEGTSLTVREILQKAGEDVESITCFQLTSKEDTGGQKVALDERIEVRNGCYLRTESKSEGEESEEESTRALGVRDIPSGGQKTGGGTSGQGRPGGAFGGAPGQQTNEQIRGPANPATTGGGSNIQKPQQSGNPGAPGQTVGGTNPSKGGQFGGSQPATPGAQQQKTGGQPYVQGQQPSTQGQQTPGGDQNREKKKPGDNR